MTAFWEGVLAGYGIAIPVGAIAVLIVEIGLRRGFRVAFVAGAGAATADLLYASLAALVDGALSSALAPFALSMRMASGLVLVGLGCYGLSRAQHVGGQQGAKSARLSGQGLLRTYVRFLGLTLLNPLTVTYFGALILGRDAGSVATTAERAAFVTGAALASLSWQTLLGGVGALAKQYLSPRFRVSSSVAGNMVVMGLGLRILVQLLS